MGRNTGAGAAWSGPVSQVLPNAVLSVEALAVAAVEPRPQPQAPQTLLKKLLGTTPTLRPRSGCGAGVAATRLPVSVSVSVNFGCLRFVLSRATYPHLTDKNAVQTSPTYLRTRSRRASSLGPTYLPHI